MTPKAFQPIFFQINPQIPKVNKPDFDVKMDDD